MNWKSGSFSSFFLESIFSAWRTFSLNSASVGLLASSSSSNFLFLSARPQCGVRSVVMLRYVFSLKFQLPIGFRYLSPAAASTHLLTFRVQGPFQGLFQTV